MRSPSKFGGLFRGANVLVFVTQEITRTIIPEQILEAIIRNVQSKTRKSLYKWMVIVKSIPSMNEKELLAILKNDHQLGHFQAKRTSRKLVDDFLLDDNIFKKNVSCDSSFGVTD